LNNGPREPGVAFDLRWRRSGKSCRNFTQRPQEAAEDAAAASSLS